LPGLSVNNEMFNIYLITSVYFLKEKVSPFSKNGLLAKWILK